MATVWGGTLVGSDITRADIRSNLEGWVLVAAVVTATGIALQRSDLYSEPTAPRTDEIAGLTRSAIFGAAMLAVTAAFTDFQLGATEILVGTTLAITALLLGRGVHRALKYQIRVNSRARVVIVGVGAEAHEVAELIQDHPEASLEVVGVIGDLGIAGQHGLGSAWLGPVDRIIELMRKHSVAAAVVTPTGFRSEQFGWITRNLFDNGYDVYLSTGITRNHAGSYGIRSVAHEPLVLLTRHEAPLWTRRIKRVMDIVGALVALVISAPVILLTALAIKIEDRGPVFFRQDRAGLNAEMFGMIKFRSMVIDAEAQKAKLADDNERTGPLFKLSRDPRITRVGRFIRDMSIDEIPQLVNVLMGDMSLVGPRPALREEEAAFVGELRARFDIRPGISGLWQVEARSNASFAAYHRLDLHYLENWSLGLDIRILMATVAQVLESVFLLPLKFLTRRGGIETIAEGGSGVVLDLREPNIEPQDLVRKMPAPAGRTIKATHPR